MKKIIAILVLLVSLSFADVSPETLYSSDAYMFDLLIYSAMPYPECVVMIYRHTDNGSLNYMAMWPASANANDAMIATFMAAAYTSEETSWSSNRVYVVILNDGMYSMSTSDARYLVNNYERRNDSWAANYLINHVRFDGEL